MKYISKASLFYGTLFILGAVYSFTACSAPESAQIVSHQENRNEQVLYREEQVSGREEQQEKGQKEEPPKQEQPAQAMNSPMPAASPGGTLPAGPDISELPRQSCSWYFNPNNEHIPPTAQEQIDLARYDAFYLGDTDAKVIYLTFDQGYENGYTAGILDTLKEKDVPAAFFLLGSYLSTNEDLVRRMQAEGHVVGNHTVHHYSMPNLSEAEIYNEITELEKNYQELTGEPLDKFFRPPSGEYSEQVLGIAQELGYQTVFWSFAYADWDVDKQPGKAAALSIVEQRYHNGCIMLLHSVSSSNAEALGEMIDMLREAGYVFGNLKDGLAGDISFHSEK